MGWVERGGAATGVLDDVFWGGFATFSPEDQGDNRAGTIVVLFSVFLFDTEFSTREE